MLGLHASQEMHPRGRLPPYPPSALGAVPGPTGTCLGINIPPAAAAHSILRSHGCFWSIESKLLGRQHYRSGSCGGKLALSFADVRTPDIPPLAHLAHIIAQIVQRVVTFLASSPACCATCLPPAWPAISPDRVQAAKGFAIDKFVVP